MKEEQNNISRVLGQKVEYPTTYDKSILVREARQTNRSHVGLVDEDLPFVGFDTWNAYEFTCLQDNGIPVAGILKLVYDCNSKYIVESKSLKLYLNSFNFYKCGDSQARCFLNAEEIISKDLSELLETDVSCCISHCGIPTCEIISEIFTPNANEPNITTVNWKLLNCCTADVAYPNDEYVEDPNLLKVVENKPCFRVQAYWCNTLFSRCKVTKQPDHGDIYIYYQGDKKIDERSLLLYITSIRNECHFHEEICETVYKRLYDLLDNPTDLAVGCFYVRRGGIDINPMRASNKTLLNYLFNEVKRADIPHIKSMKQ